MTDWPHLISQAYRCTKPGGYVELAEIALVAKCDDGTLAEDNGLKRFLELVGAAMEMMGRPRYITSEILRATLGGAGSIDPSLVLHSDLLEN